MTNEEREALIKVRNELNTGVYTPVLAMDDHTPLGFDMSLACSICGSVRCIGGWMMLHLNPNATRLEVRDFVDYGGTEQDMQDLFFPQNLTARNWDFITPAHAVDAIDNFLRDGDPRWDQVLEGVTVDAD